MSKRIYYDGYELVKKEEGDRLVKILHYVDEEIRDKIVIDNDYNYVDIYTEYDHVCKEFTPKEFEDVIKRMADIKDPWTMEDFISYVELHGHECLHPCYIKSDAVYLDKETLKKLGLPFENGGLIIGVELYDGYEWRLYNALGKLLEVIFMNDKASEKIIKKAEELGIKLNYKPYDTELYDVEISC